MQKASKYMTECSIVIVSFFIFSTVCIFGWRSNRGNSIIDKYKNAADEIKSSGSFVDKCLLFLLGIVMLFRGGSKLLFSFLPVIGTLAITAVCSARFEYIANLFLEIYKMISDQR